MSDFNMPPGVSVSDIPGNRPVAEAARQSESAKPQPQGRASDSVDPQARRV